MKVQVKAAHRKPAYIGEVIGDPIAVCNRVSFIVCDVETQQLLTAFVTDCTRVLDMPEQANAKPAPVVAKSTASTSTK